MIADGAGELTKAFVRSFLARRGAGCNQTSANLLFQQFGREIKMGKAAGVRLLSFAVICLTLAGWLPLAAQTPTLSCQDGQRVKQVAELLFGRDVGRRTAVSTSAWAHFVAHELIARFADGLTVTDAIGQWRDPVGGTIVREPTKKVEIVLPGNADDQARLDAVVKAYKREFRQRSVGVIVRPACVSF
jgi:hypothetical protein